MQMNIQELTRSIKRPATITSAPQIVVGMYHAIGPSRSTAILEGFRFSEEVNRIGKSHMVVKGETIN